MLYALKTSDVQIPQLENGFSCPKLIDLLNWLEPVVCHRMYVCPEFAECEITHSHVNGKCDSLHWELRNMKDINKLATVLYNDPDAPEIAEVAAYLTVKEQNDGIEKKLTYLCCQDGSLAKVD